jgi:hypothetical protein
MKPEKGVDAPSTAQRMLMDVGNSNYKDVMQNLPLRIWNGVQTAKNFGAGNHFVIFTIIGPVSHDAVTTIAFCVM